MCVCVCGGGGGGGGGDHWTPQVVIFSTKYCRCLPQLLAKLFLFSSHCEHFRQMNLDNY